LAVQETGPARVPDDWFVGFHRGLAARFWRAAGATMADADARLVRELLELEPAAVLDVPCGDGRLAVRLAAGHAVVGIDLAGGELELARRAAAVRVRGRRMSTVDRRRVSRDAGGYA
jgi:cyclopropane fatty-acyl-phospholipid synthase-like methyltransferase